MTPGKPTPARLERVIESLPRTYAGPGGAVAVVRAGEVVVRHAWGWANAERRIEFTPQSLFRICSISKQFTCGVALDMFPDLAVLDGDVRARLPRLEGAAPPALRLCHNQSGLRDYWAVAMLHGAPAESGFGESEADQVIERTRSLQFAPGTRYSYANQNFRILSDIVQDRAGRSFAELLRTRIFAPAGMESAILAADTRALADGTEGYEGSVAGGFRAAENRILWTGDAGIGASLDDMIAWERFIDATRDDEHGLYRRLSAPVTFADGTPTRYGFGLGRGKELGRAVTGHGGGLRGWRSHRLHVAAERLSVVVLFNHMADAHDAAVDVLAAALDEEKPRKPAAAPAPAWLGAYLEPETGLAVRLESAAEGQVRVRYGYPPEALDLQADGSAGTERTRLRSLDGGIEMERPSENHRSRLAPLAKAEGGAGEIAGHYRCAELEARITIVDAGGVAYGAFSGFLGQGRMEQLEPIGADVWALPCPRALDDTAPGDWTLAFQRDGAGKWDPLESTCRHASLSIL